MWDRNYVCDYRAWTGSTCNAMAFYSKSRYGGRHASLLESIWIHLYNMILILTSPFLPLKFSTMCGESSPGREKPATPFASQVTRRSNFINNIVIGNNFKSEIFEVGLLQILTLPWGL